MMHGQKSIKKLDIKPRTMGLFSAIFGLFCILLFYTLMEKFCGLGIFLKLRVNSLTPVLILSHPLVTFSFQKLGPPLSELTPV
jgi:hypothetical protein